MTDIGIIPIGRNEGERLRRCLASVVGRGFPVVYVDSASTDGSPALARSVGADVVDLDMSIPFSAARARNEGFDRLVQIAPRVRYVMFVDGDCEVVPTWLDRARGALEADPQVAVVCGRRRERHPEQSIYNRLADVEWNAPVGEVQSCGGDAMFRSDAFERAGAFNASIVAGEEPELCQRLRAAGWKVHRIDAEMTIHDSAMTRFAQWASRQVRSGYGAADVAARFGDRGLFANQVRSARRWVAGYATALAFAVTFTVIASLGPWDGSARIALFALAASLTLLLPLQMLRTAWGIRRRAGDARTALAYGVLTMLGKWYHVRGQNQYAADRRAGKNTRLIDYKAAGTATVPGAPSLASPS